MSVLDKKNENTTKNAKKQPKEYIFGFSQMD